MNENLITIQDLCNELDISKSTAYRIIKSGVLPHGRIGRKIIIHKSELDRFIRTKTQSIPLKNKYPPAKPVVL